MGDLTEHFSTCEFACRCGCGASHVEPRLLEALEALRKVVGRPVRVTSGVRCAVHNRSVGGVEGSQHLSGRAVDIVVGGVAPGSVGWIGRALGRFAGIKIYEGWTHLDVREGERWWRGF